MYYIFFAIKQKENKELSKDIFRVFQHKLSCHVPSIIICQFEILLINVFGMHISSIILQVSTIMQVPLPRSQIGPCLKC